MAHGMVQRHGTRAAASVMANNREDESGGNIGIGATPPTTQEQVGPQSRKP